MSDLNLDFLKRAPVALAQARSILARDNARADQIEWERFCALITDMIAKHGIENVQGALTQAKENIDEAAREAEEARAAEQLRREQYYLRRFGRYPME